MNVHAPAAGFGYRDFALLRVPQEVVVLAVARSIREAEEAAELDRAGEAMRAAGPDPVRAAQPSYGIRRGAAAAGHATTRSVPGACEAEAAQTECLDGWDDVRVSRLAAAPDWTLVECRDLIPGFSPIAFGLSVALPATDVLCFRRSGAAAAAVEAQHEFHLYREGHMQRRVLCQANRAHHGAEREECDCIADEPQARQGPDRPQGRQAGADPLAGQAIEAILGRIGLTTGALFRPGAAADPILFSRRPGGAPLPV